MILLKTLEDDLRYEEERGEEQTSPQEDQGEDEMLHSEWLQWLLLFVHNVWNYIVHQSSLGLKI